MKTTTLFLVRHGETQWNVESRIQGHLDTPLNRIGESQAQALGARLLRERFDAAYSSDLSRAWHTARMSVLDPERNIIRDGRLRERHLGVLQGLTHAEATIDQPKAWQALQSRDAHRALTGGESLGEFSRRVLGFMDNIVEKHAGARVLVVTHGGVLDEVYRRAKGLPHAVPRNFPIYNASVNVLRHGNGTWDIEAWDDVSHLSQIPALDDASEAVMVPNCAKTTIKV